MRCAVWLVAVAGCDWALGIDSYRAADASPVHCIAPTFFQPDFQGTDACKEWGMPFGVMPDTVTQGGGSLTITKQSGPGPSGCEAISPIRFDELGVFVAIDQALQTPGAYTTLMMLQTMDMSMHRWGIDVEPGGLISFHIDGMRKNTVPYVASDMRFVRLHTDGQIAVVAEYSSDAANWRELDRDPTPPPLMVFPDLSAGESQMPVAADTAVYSHFNVCP